MAHSQVVVVGAGAAGCAAAYFMARAGLEVLLLEREGVAAAASGTAAGAINPLHGRGIPGPLEAAAMEAFRLHLALWPELERESGMRFAARVRPRVHVAMNAAELERLEKLAARCRAHPGFSARWLDAAALRGLEPRLGGEALGGLWTDGGGELDAAAYVHALARAAERRGVQAQRAEVHGVRARGARVQAVRTSAGDITCDAVVAATGPWVEWLRAGCGVELAVEPLKGEILRLRMPARPVAIELTSEAVSLYPRGGDELWVGATHERAGFDTTPSAAARGKLLGHAGRLVAGLADARVVAHTACLRPVTADALPLVAQADGWDNLFVATGGGAKGLLLSPFMGRRVARLLAPPGAGR